MQDDIADSVICELLSEWAAWWCPPHETIGPYHWACAFEDVARDKCRPPFA